MHINKVADVSEFITEYAKEACYEMNFECNEVKIGVIYKHQEPRWSYSIDSLTKNVHIASSIDEKIDDFINIEKSYIVPIETYYILQSEILKYHHIQQAFMYKLKKMIELYIKSNIVTNPKASCIYITYRNHELAPFYYTEHSSIRNRLYACFSAIIAHKGFILDIPVKE